VDVSLQRAADHLTVVQYLRILQELWGSVNRAQKSEVRKEESGIGNRESGIGMPDVSYHQMSGADDI
jgi:hypothetical protein